MNPSGFGMYQNGINNYGNTGLYPNNIPYGAQNGIPYGAQNGVPYGGNSYNQYPNNIRTAPVRYNAASAAKVCITSIAFFFGIAGFIF